MISSICFLTTYQCTARCDYCECGPDTRGSIGLADMKRLMDEGLTLGTVALVVFSGGEPTLLGRDLFEAIRYANDRGVLTRLVTNGWWGRTAEEACDYVDRLLEAGLHEINISIDDLHQRWIGLEQVKNAFLACYQKQLRCLIAHKQTLDAKITRSFLEEYFGLELIPFDYTKTYEGDEQYRLISTTTVIPVGRNEQFADMSRHRITPWKGSCGSVLREIVVGADMRLLPCCGIVSKYIPELTRNSLDTTSLIDAIDEANNDPVLNFLALEGPASLMDFIKKHDNGIEFEDDYAGICHACNEVLTREDCRRILNRHYDELEYRVSVHRAYFEGIRAIPHLVQSYIRR